MKLSETTINELTCLCGLCNHEIWDKDCPYAQVVDKQDPSKELYKRVERLIVREKNLTKMEANKKIDRLKQRLQAK